MGIQLNCEKPYSNGWLRAFRANPQMPSREVQAALQEQFDIYVSIGHLNRVRGQLGIENHRGRSKKNSKRSLLPPLPQWQEGAGALLLVAAANTSGLLEALETALSCCAPQAGSRLAHLSTSSRQSLLQTLLFLGVVGLSRPWGLRGYTGDALGRLPGRSRAYGYFHTERFLAELARSNGAEAFTSALARWTTRLWQSEVSAGMNVSALFYIDGHRKPVYTDALIPRGLVGRLSTILGSRTLVLLHDASGHPLLITTHRGDQHLTSGLPTVIKQYKQEAGLGTVRYLVVDREAMAAEFLAALKETGRTAISVLRTDQYGGLDRE